MSTQTSRPCTEGEASVAGEELKPENTSTSNAETARKLPSRSDCAADPKLEENEVDEAGWESIPASDPPAIGGAKKPRQF